MATALIDAIINKNKATNPLVDSIVNQASAYKNHPNVPKPTIGGVINTSSIKQNQPTMNAGALSVMVGTQRGLIGPIINRKYYGGL
jgi:hypothetical protein